MSDPLSETCIYCGAPDVMDDAFICNGRECWDRWKLRPLDGEFEYRVTLARPGLHGPATAVSCSAYELARELREHTEHYARRELMAVVRAERRFVTTWETLSPEHVSDLPGSPSQAPADARAETEDETTPPSASRVSGGREGLESVEFELGEFAEYCRFVAAKSVGGQRDQWLERADWVDGLVARVVADRELHARGLSPDV